MTNNNPAVNNSTFGADTYQQRFFATPYQKLCDLYFQTEKLRFPSSILNETVSIFEQLFPEIQFSKELRNALGCIHWPLDHRIVCIRSVLVYTTQDQYNKQTNLQQSNRQSHNAEAIAQELHRSIIAVLKIAETNRLEQRQFEEFGQQSLLVEFRCKLRLLRELHYQIYKDWFKPELYEQYTVNQLK